MSETLKRIYDEIDMAIDEFKEKLKDDLMVGGSIVLSVGKDDMTRSEIAIIKDIIGGDE